MSEKQPIHNIRPKTNVEFIVDCMEYSEHGALVQAFIIQGLLTYCDMVEATDAQSLSNGLIDGAKWRAISAELKDKLDKRYNPLKRVDESTVIMTSAKDHQDFRMTPEEFTDSILKRGLTKEDGTAYWGSLETISNVEAFAERPRWATCVYFIPTKKG